MPAKAQRRIFTAEEKRRILEGLTVRWRMAVMLALIPRREGIYSSTLQAAAKNAPERYTKPFLRPEVRSRIRIRWLPKTKSCAGTFNAYQEELEKAHIINWGFSFDKRK